MNQGNKPNDEKVSKSSMKNTAGSSSNGERSPKIVSFADAYGRDLVEIRNYLPSNESLQIQNSLESISIPKIFNVSTSSISDCSGDIKWISYFKDVDPSSTLYYEDLSRRKVILERLTILEQDISGSPNLYGLIRVSNIGYEKNVFVRATYNNWASYSDSTAKYEAHCQTTNTDLFSISIKFDSTLPSSCSFMEFAIAYQVNNETYWDNNKGSNYKIYRI